MAQSRAFVKYLGICDEVIRDGLWLQTVSVNSGYYQTRSGQLWRGIICRLNKGAYSEVAMNFSGYQEFANWCHSQEEFYLEDHHLDKDLIGNSFEYSPTTCCFIPASLNVLLQGVGSFRRGEMVGSSFSKRNSCWRGYCNIDGTQLHLGYFGTQQEAHLAWCKKKSEILVDRMTNYPLKFQPAILEIANELVKETEQ